MIGADLARERLRRFPGLSDPSIGVIDTGFRIRGLNPVRVDLDPTDGWKRSWSRTFRGPADPEHGTFVANAIIEYPPFGASERGFITALASVGDDEMESAFEFMARKDVRLLNISMFWPGDQTNRSAIARRLADGRRLIVTTTGNSHPAAVPPSKNLMGMIVVGSINFFGEIASDSQEADFVDIAAPHTCVDLRKSAARNPMPTGSSCAAPLVTGTLANVVALLPDLTVEQARTLLRRTALQTLNSRQVPQRNGVGMVNSYKMLRVAERARELAARSSRSLDEILATDSVYDFKDEAKDLLKRGLDLFASNDCEAKKRGMNLIRESHFLDENEPARLVLEAASRRQGYLFMAEYFRTLDRQYQPARLRAETL